MIKTATAKRATKATRITAMILTAMIAFGADSSRAPLNAGSINEETKTQTTSEG